VQELPCILGRTQDHRATAENAGRDSALQGFRCGCERHAARLHARHETMLGYRDQRCIEHATLRIARQLTGHEQPHVVGERDLAHEFRDQIASPHENRRRVRRGDRRGAMRLRADLH
jgi:hypothetical protein